MAIIRPKTIIQCTYCDKAVEKVAAVINAARKNNRGMFCNSGCSGRFHAALRRSEFVIPTKKKCQVCEETKPLNDFHRNKASLDGRVISCKVCCSVTKRAWGAKNKSKIAIAEKKRKYGLTPIDEAKRCESQDGRCAICRNPRILVIDHDHIRGSIRGMLCQRCNIGLGFFGDNLKGILKAVAYLERSNVDNND